MNSLLFLFHIIRKENVTLKLLKQCSMDKKIYEETLA